MSKANVLNLPGSKRNLAVLICYPHEKANRQSSKGEVHVTERLIDFRKHYPLRLNMGFDDCAKFPFGGHSVQP